MVLEAGKQIRDKRKCQGKQDSSHWKGSCMRGPGTLEVKKEEDKLQVFVRILRTLPNLVQPCSCLSYSLKENRGLFGAEIE